MTPPLEFTRVQITAPLIPLEEAKAQLHVTGTAQDAEVGRYVLQAQNTILDYLKAGADPDWTDATLPLPVRVSILRLLEHLFANRDATDMPVSDEHVWDAIGRQLARFRDPALA